MAAGATQSLLSDAVDKMLAVRNHKVAAAAAAAETSLSIVPSSVPLSPSALSDNNMKSTASTSSDGQVQISVVEGS